MRATLLLPALASFGRQRISGDIAKTLGRADRTAHPASGRRAQVLRHFTLLPAYWPLAALLRQAEVGDAADAAWLRADPAHVRPDINGARLMAYGDALALIEEDRAALLPALRPVFGDAGFILEAATPAHWYLRLPREAKVPAFTEPADALGEDLFEHLAEGSEGRRWRALLSDTQVVLHNHPWNAQRAAQGKPAVNSLWFWGGGVLPDRVDSVQNSVRSDDAVLRAFAAAAGIDGQPLPRRFETSSGDALFDLRDQRDLASVEADWLSPAVAALRQGTLSRLALDCEDGDVFHVAAAQRWRFWRQPWAQPVR